MTSKITDQWPYTELISKGARISDLRNAMHRVFGAIDAGAGPERILTILNAALDADRQAEETEQNHPSQPVNQWRASQAATPPDAE